MDGLIYDAGTGHCVLTVLRPGKTPAGKEVRAHLRRLVRRIRMHWPETRTTFRGDSHYGRREAMDWCEKNDVRYIFGLSVPRQSRWECATIRMGISLRGCRRREGVA